MKKIIVNNGEKFNRLTIIQEIEKHIKPSGEKIRMFECLCDCGNIKKVSLSDLRSNNTKSCGCLNLENLKNSSIKHSHWINGNPTSEYNSYQALKQRCYNKNRKNYFNYGGRGIKVCDRWLNSFINFLEDMGPKPNNKYSIDRIDVNGNYEPSNCRWSTQKEQQNNKRNNK
jgi:hypothetical protein